MVLSRELNLLYIRGNVRYLARASSIACRRTKPVTIAKLSRDMSNTPGIYPLLLLCLVCLLLPGCSSNTVKYYSLEAVGKPSPGTTPDSGDKDLVIGIGPVGFPAYLERKELVMRDSASELFPLKYHQWSESLQTGFTQVLVQDLALLMPSVRVILAPSNRNEKITHQVTIDVHRFDSDTLGETVLETQMTLVRTADPGRTLSSKSSLALKNKPVQDYDGMVRVMGKLVRQLARQIVELVREKQAAG